MIILNQHTPSQKIELNVLQGLSFCFWQVLGHKHDTKQATHTKDPKCARLAKKFLKRNEFFGYEERTEPVGECGNTTRCTSCWGGENF